MQILAHKSRGALFEEYWGDFGPSTGGSGKASAAPHAPATNIQEFHEQYVELHGREPSDDDLLEAAIANNWLP